MSEAHSKNAKTHDFPLLSRWGRTRLKVCFRLGIYQIVKTTEQSNILSHHARISMNLPKFIPRTQIRLISEHISHKGNDDSRHYNGLLKF